MSVYSNGSTGEATQELAQEHGVLLRQLGRLQSRMALLLAGHAKEVQRLQAEVLRLRGRLLVASTRVYWGLGARLDAPFYLPSGSVVPGVDATARKPVATAAAVLCQTGCVGHAHHWLGEDGQCRLNGEPCVRLQGAALVGTVLPWSTDR